MTLRLGTRGSALALAQSQLVADAITAATGEPVELVEIVTDGDRSSAPVPELGVGVFVSALRDALAAKEIDLAVHSYKDLPTAPVEGLTIAAVPLREEPLDALVSHTGVGLPDLPPGSRIGTGAPRRIAQLRALDRAFECVPLRGNVDTRLRKLAAGEVDALVLAAAGLRRLGRAAEISQVLPPEVMLPAPAQGALAVECRSGDHGLVEQLRCVNDEHSRAAVLAERTLLATLEAGCSAPVAGLARIATDTVDSGPQVHLWAAVLAPDGSRAIRGRGTGALSEAAEVGSRLAARLLADGADLLLGDITRDPGASQRARASEERTGRAGGDSARVPGASQRAQASEERTGRAGGDRA